MVNKNSKTFKWDVLLLNDYAVRFFFFNKVYKRIDFDIYIGNDNWFFSSHWRKKAYIANLPKEK